MKITDIFEGPYMRKEKAKLNRAVLKKARAIEGIDFTGKDGALKAITTEYMTAYKELVNGATAKVKEVEPTTKKKKAAPAKKKVAKKKTEKTDTSELV